MLTVTYEEFLDFNPCWLEYEGGKERIKAYFDRFGGRMSALDILNLDDVSAEDKLWSVLREEFIPAPILHEFACICAECALSLINNPDPRSIQAIETKRAWLRNEVTTEELLDAMGAAMNAAWVDIGNLTKDATRDAAWAAVAAARAAWAAVDAVDAARSAAWDAANNTAWTAVRISKATANDTTWLVSGTAMREAQVAYLIMVLEEEK